MCECVCACARALEVIQKMCLTGACNVVELPRKQFHSNERALLDHIAIIYTIQQLLGFLFSARVCVCVCYVMFCFIFYLFIFFIVSSVLCGLVHGCVRVLAVSRLYDAFSTLKMAWGCHAV